MKSLYSHVAAHLELVILAKLDQFKNKSETGNISIWFFDKSSNLNQFISLITSLRNVLEEHSKESSFEIYKNEISPILSEINIHVVKVYLNLRNPYDTEFITSIIIPLKEIISKLTLHYYEALEEDRRNFRALF